MRGVQLVCMAGCIAFGAIESGAQSLFQRRSTQAVVGVESDPSEALYGVSLYAIEPPRPRQFAPHDLITIVINQASSAKRTHTLETEKEVSSKVQMATLDAMSRFLELRGNVPAGTIDLSPLIDVETEFSGDGEYKRKDSIVARVTAEVLEVKPNGNLLIEAKARVQTDEEVQTIVLSGLCRGTDITEANTVMSSQLADLNLVIHHEGDLKKTNEKGVITQVLDTLFNF